jgi:glycosyltransferase involved in cell wall biosynthesis
MNILFYNWVDYDDLEERGGGVSVYQKNLINEFLRSGEDTLCFLSSGIAYDFGSRPYIRGLPGRQGVRRFEIVNSGVLSPAHHSFFSRAAISHPETEAAFSDFLEREGPFDVVHFNNLEGLPANVLALRKKFAETRFIFSLHNYYAFCPQVNLWYQENEHCVDHWNGDKCAGCLLREIPAAAIVNANRLAFFLKKFGFMPRGLVFETAFKYGPTVKRILSRLLRPMRAVYRKRAPEGRGRGLASLKPDAVPFRRRRETFVDLINQNVDWVLAVSRRVGEIAAEFGIDEGKIVVSYIGTRHAEIYERETQRRRRLLNDSGELVLCYLGYMRRDKGFYFLLDALDRLPRDVASRIRLVAAARNTDPRALAKLEELAVRYRDVLYADGYTHDQLDAVLKDVTLGVVPVLWEDNLPQVAVEMFCRGIALLCSDKGGAKELGGSAAFTFRAGDAEDFSRAVVSVLEGDITAEDFWRHSIKPPSMQEHVASLRSRYRCNPHKASAEPPRARVA